MIAEQILHIIPCTNQLIIIDTKLAMYMYKTLGHSSKIHMNSTESHTHNSDIKVFGLGIRSTVLYVNIFSERGIALTKAHGNLLLSRKVFWEGAELRKVTMF